MASEKIWLITGASRGIGLAAARLTVAGGNRVALLARGEAVHQAAAELGSDALGVQADVADPESVAAAVEQVVSHFGGLDVVVNNAGLHRGGKVGRLALDDWQAVINTNLTGALNVISAARPHLTRVVPARVLQTLSLGHERTQRTTATYFSKRQTRARSASET